VARNGQKRQRSPRIEIVSPVASAGEAAAIVAAVESFLAETAPPPATDAEPESGWLRAALREGVEKPSYRWGDA
jgi:hypothetical protein